MMHYRLFTLNYARDSSIVIEVVIYAFYGQYYNYHCVVGFVVFKGGHLCGLPYFFRGVVQLVECLVWDQMVACSSQVTPTEEIIMKSFNVINYDCNAKKFKWYDVMPYLIERYKERKKKDRPKGFEEIKKFIRDESMYQFWSRCEYEILLVDWPCQKQSDKIDIFDQIMMNIDVVTNVFIENIQKIK